MKLTRPDLVSDLAVRGNHRRPEYRAIGDNFAFDEYVGDARAAEFEAETEFDLGLLAAGKAYFDASVQGCGVAMCRRRSAR